MGNYVDISKNSKSSSYANREVVTRPWWSTRVSFYGSDVLFGNMYVPWELHGRMSQCVCPRPHENSPEESVTRTNSWPRFVASINGLPVVWMVLTPLFPYYVVKDSVGPTNLFLLSCATNSFVYLLRILDFSE